MYKLKSILPTFSSFVKNNICGHFFKTLIFMKLFNFLYKTKFFLSGLKSFIFSVYLDQIMKYYEKC